MISIPVPYEKHGRLLLSNCEIAKLHPHKRRDGPVNRKHFKFSQIALQSSTKVMFNYLDVMFILGCAHSHSECASKRRRIENHVNLVSSRDQSTLEKVISSSIKRIRPGDKNTMQLQTLGKPTSLQLGSPEAWVTISIV